MTPLRSRRIAAGECIDCTAPTGGPVRCPDCARHKSGVDSARYWATHKPVRKCSLCAQRGHNAKTCGRERADAA